jgi:cytidyltransferase-like protein
MASSKFILNPLNNFMFSFRQFLEEEGQPVVLVACGSFSPVHKGHISMFETAKQWLETHGYKVVGGVISPKHDAYVQSKGGDGIPIQDRVNMLKLATQGTWIKIDTWEASQASPKNRFVVLQHLQQQYPNAQVAFLCGEDANFYGTPPSIPGAMNVQGFLYVVVPRPPASISSTKVKQLLQAGQSTGGMLHPAVEEYMKHYYQKAA